MRKQEIVKLTQRKLMAVPPDERTKEWYKSLRTEYQVAMRYAIHCTELSWQVGSILIGGSLAAVSLSLTTKAKIPTVLITLGAIAAILTWFLFQRRNAGFAGVATDRMIEIEQQLGLALHTKARYFGRSEPSNRVGGPKGSITATFLAFGLILVLSVLALFLLIWT
jgi:UDP-N-acetylmuramyl pentapeptide phosphotransferase/UDP-N-acetylglucosamine-1-phosphate transferase